MTQVDKRIRHALSDAIATGEVGVQVAAFVDDELIVDASAGTMGGVDDDPVDSDTLFSVFSITKAVTATAAHLQTQRGLLAYDEPIAEVWPEFSANGKS